MGGPNAEISTADSVAGLKSILQASRARAKRLVHRIQRQSDPLVALKELARPTQKRRSQRRNRSQCRGAQPISIHCRPTSRSTNACLIGRTCRWSAIAGKPQERFHRVFEAMIQSPTLVRAGVWRRSLCGKLVDYPYNEIVFVVRGVDFDYRCAWEGNPFRFGGLFFPEEGIQRRLAATREDQDISHDGGSAGDVVI